MGLALVVIALLIFSNFVQLGVALHDRRQIVSHSSELALLHARKTIALADASRELQKLSYKQNASDQISLNLFIQFVPGFVEGDVLSNFHGNNSIRLMEIAHMLNVTAKEGMDSDCPICAIEPIPEVAVGELGGPLELVKPRRTR